MTDYLMPDMAGIELMTHIRQLQPTVHTAPLTGHGVAPAYEACWTQERHLEKPHRVNEQREVVAELIWPPPDLVGRLSRARSHMTALVALDELTMPVI